MKPDEWRTLARRLERVARERPGAYRRRVAALAALGYAYVLGVFGLLFAVAGACVYVSLTTPGALRLAVPLLLVILGVARSLWVSFPPPGGIPLTPDQGLPLLELAEQLRRDLEAPRIHEIRIDGDMNAGVAQVPRLGPLGWYRNYLVVGLPLLQALTAAELEAILAHELGHLARKDGGFGASIHRVAATWDQLVAHLRRRRSRPAFLFAGFFRWYAPRFGAYTFALQRGNEYRADAFAAAKAGPAVVAGALLETELVAGFLAHRFWPGVLRRADDEPEPPPAIFDELAATLSSPEPPESAGRFLEVALRASDELRDGHPPLAARLAALGVSVDEGLAATSAGGARTAADVYLGGVQPLLQRRLSEIWREAMRERWGQAHAEARTAHARLRELERARALDPAGARELAVLTERFHGEETAGPLYQHVLAQNPKDAVAHFALGRMLLAREQVAGLIHLDEAMACDPDATFAACDLAVGFLQSRGRDEDAERYRRHADRRLQAVAT